MEMKRMPNCIKGQDLREKTVLVRVDYNSSLEDGEVSDSFRIDASAETIRYCLHQNAKVVLISHFGRPSGIDTSLSLENVIGVIENSLGHKVRFFPDCVGNATQQFVLSQPHSSVILLENLRFYGGEKRNEAEFAKQLKRLGDVYVNEAFSASHNPDASMTSLPQLFPEDMRFAGFHLIEEIQLMEEALSRPKKGYVLVVGGSKVEAKLPVIKHFIDTAERILLGGRVANSVLSALGYQTWSSNVSLGTDVHELAELVKTNGSLFYLPNDFCGIASYFLEPVGLTDMKFYDIGESTSALYCRIIEKADSIVHAGPLGHIEVPDFRKGTEAVAKAVANNHSFKLVGGGETLSVYSSLKLLNQVHASTGGSAMLHYLSGQNMPGITALM